MGIFGSFGKGKISREDVRRKQKYASGRWQIGNKILDRYEIHDIKRGGMGIVYICYDHQEKTPFALKTFQEQYLFCEETQKLFEREALLWIELERHPYIVRANSVDRLVGRLFIILEYIAPDEQERNTLTHYLSNLTLPEILKFSIQFCYGMEYAYSKGIAVHRDIKPDNIMITQDKTVKITDFGLAKAFNEIELEGEETIPRGEKASLGIYRIKGKRIAGTLPYMAPEQFDGYADRKSDIYAFGVVLYQMVSGGRVPFIGRNIEEYESLHKSARVPSLSSPLFPLIAKCLEKEPVKRFQNFTSLGEEFQNFLLRETGEQVIQPQGQELKAWEWVNKGHSLNNLGRYLIAIGCYEKALEINPKCAEAWYNQGHAIRNIALQGHTPRNLIMYREAIDCYDKALEISPKIAEAWIGKGVTLGYLGKHEEEIACYDKTLEINPMDVHTWNNKGLALRHLGNRQEEIVCYDKALEINPMYVIALYNKGVTLYNLGKYSEALKCAEEAIRLNPNLTQAHQLKQLILEKLRR